MKVQNKLNYLILFIILVFLCRFIQCLYGKLKNKNVYPNCPLSPNGIKNTFSILLNIIIILILIKLYIK